MSDPQLACDIDIEQPDALLRYLRATKRIDLTEPSPRMTVLHGGVSNRTVLVERANGEAWVMKQALPKLRVAVDWFSDPARIQREAAALRTLAVLAPPDTITPLVFEDPQHHVLAMTAVPQPHDNWKSLLLAGRIMPDHVRQFAGLLGTIHRRSSEQAQTLATAFAERSFFESLRLEPYYAYTAMQVPEAAAFYDAVLARTRAQRSTLVHGDFSPKNVLVREGRLILLDHEVVHWGDPAFDVGFALTHLLSKAHHLPERRSAFGAAAKLFWDVYCDDVAALPGSGDIERRSVEHTICCLLARVAGRSPLEYLGAHERAAQRRAAAALMADVPPTVTDLVDAFLERL